MHMWEEGCSRTHAPLASQFLLWPYGVKHGRNAHSLIPLKTLYCQPTVHPHTDFFFLYDCTVILSVYEKTLPISFMMNFTFSLRTFLICHIWMHSTSLHILYGMRLCALRHDCKMGSSELVYAPLDLSRFFSPLSFECLLEIPLDKNQLLSSLTGKPLQQTVHYSHRAPASPLPSSFFALTHIHIILLLFVFLPLKQRLLTSNSTWA